MASSMAHRKLRTARLEQRAAGSDGRKDQGSLPMLEPLASSRYPIGPAPMMTADMPAH